MSFRAPCPSNSPANVVAPSNKYWKVQQPSAGTYKTRRKISSYVLLSGLIIGIFISVLLQFLFMMSMSPPATNAANNAKHLKKAYARSKNIHKDNDSRSSHSVSACLLIKDDNEILNEWIAYHYHVLRLRYIVVAVDPTSTVAPNAIFEKWQNETDLSIEIWSDQDFIPKGLSANQFEGDDLQTKKHRFRQMTFVSSCFRHMAAQNKTWVMHIDTDEYVVVNPFLRRAQGKFPPSNHTVQLTPIVEPSSVYGLLQQVYNNPYLQGKSNYPCISIPRLLFGSVEENEAAMDQPEQNLARISTGHYVHNKNLLTKEEQLQTKRWAFHTSYDDKERNGQPKVIVDVSVVPANDRMFWRKPFSPHRPSTKLCRGIAEISFPATESYPLSINHYLGTWERYNARNDTRRSAHIYDFKAGVRAGRDRWISSWLDGFIKTVGQEKAKLLLEGHGTIE